MELKLKIMVIVIEVQRTLNNGEAIHTGQIKHPNGREVIGRFEINDRNLKDLIDSNVLTENPHTERQFKNCFKKIPCPEIDND